MFANTCIRLKTKLIEKERRTRLGRQMSSQMSGTERFQSPGRQSLPERRKGECG
ncbi:hypothetical protein GCWU000341_02531 [Oribacterium sp. oral taxon 078 str. F0262]|nr:hypothetical protein GCWU000341_02531 [Oribacterium sp. oral taxon 078 str. F0262]